MTQTEALTYTINKLVNFVGMTRENMDDSEQFISAQISSLDPYNLISNANHIIENTFEIYNDITDKHSNLVEKIDLIEDNLLSTTESLSNDIYCVSVMTVGIDSYLSNIENSISNSLEIYEDISGLISNDVNNMIISNSFAIDQIVNYAFSDHTFLSQEIEFLSSKNEIIDSELSSSIRILSSLICELSGKITN